MTDKPNLAALIAGVKVKPLEWEAGERDQRCADSILGEFCVTFFGGRWFYQGEPRKGMLDAQAAAQADYEARILAALEAAPVPDLVEEAGKVLEGVTTGPWVREAQGVYHSNGHGLVAHLKPHEWGRDWPTLERDGDFIAWCREGVPALIALATAQAAQIAEKERTYEELYADALADAKSDAQDFDSELWKMVRAYLDELHFDWRDFMEDGVTADEAIEHIRECMNEETRRAEAAETALAAERAKVAKLVEALNAAEAWIEALTAERDGLLEAQADKRRLAREIDVVLHGDEAASQASLCDLVQPAREMRAARAKAETEAATLRAEVERLRGRLQDMVAVAEQDGWDKAMTGRQLVIADARAALEGKA